MSKNFSAIEFYKYIQDNETNKEFITELASDLGVSEKSLKAAYISCRMTDASNVATLRNLYVFYLNAPVEIILPPQVEDKNGDLQDAPLTRLQKARLKAMGKVYNPNATAKECADDLRRVAAKFPLSNVTETMYLEYGSYAMDTWSKHFGSWLGFTRGAGLKLSLEQTRYRTQTARQSGLDLYRDYYSKEVLPYANKYEVKSNGDRFRQIVVASDFHARKTRPFANGVFIDTCKEMQPHIICLNGDLFDNYEFSRYEIDIRGCDVAAEFQFVKEHIFGALRDACPKSQIDFIIGNHDWRILKMLAEAHPNIRTLIHDVMGLTLADVFGVHEFGINLVTKSDLDFSANTKSAVFKQLRKNYKVYYDCYVAAHIKDYGFGLSGTSGHVHRSSFDTSKTLAAGPLSWMTTAAMCETDEGYVEGFDKARNGFGLVTIDTKTDSVVQQLIDIPADFTMVNGRLYEAKNYVKHLGE